MSLTANSSLPKVWQIELIDQVTWCRNDPYQGRPEERGQRALPRHGPQPAGERGRQQGYDDQLAILSFGESWHNLHHADPTCARHGVLKGQIDIAARTIWLAGKLGWVYDIRWPEEARLAARHAGETRKFGGMTRRVAAKPIR